MHRDDDSTGWDKLDDEAAAWDKLAPVGLARIQEEIRLYKLDLRHGLGGARCSEKAEIILRSIYKAHIESCVPNPRVAYVIHRRYPSRQLLVFLKMRFSGDHTDGGSLLALGLDEPTVKHQNDTTLTLALAQWADNVSATSTAKALSISERWLVEPYVAEAVRIGYLYVHQRSMEMILVTIHNLPDRSHP